MAKPCYWTFIDCLESNKNGTPVKWQLKTDCGEAIVMTPQNKYGKLHNLACEPYEQGSPNPVKCRFCGKSLEFYNPYDD